MIRGDLTNGITDLLPTTSMLPGPMPAVAVLFDVDDSSATVFDEIEDVFATEAILLHDLWTIAFNDNIGLFDKFQELETVLFVLEMQMGCPFSYKSMLA